MRTDNSETGINWHSAQPYETMTNAMQYVMAKIIFVFLPYQRMSCVTRMLCKRVAMCRHAGLDSGAVSSITSVSELGADQPTLSGMQSATRRSCTLTLRMKSHGGIHNTRRRQNPTACMDAILDQFSRRLLACGGEHRVYFDTTRHTSSSSNNISCRHVIERSHVGAV